MIPNFALGLTDDGITLWHRDAAGWLRVGAVPPDSADLDSRMHALVGTARALAPEGLLTKLVIPDDQILFCDLAVHGATEDRKREILRGQLAGRTPYPVEELVFDWVEQREGAHVAVVARETLLEAEDFAAGYGLNPVSAVAAPATARFTKEPFFCTTRIAKDLIDAPESLAHHRDTVREAGTASLPQASKPATTQPKPPEPKMAAAPAAPAEPPETKPAPDPTPMAQDAGDQTTAAIAQVTGSPAEITASAEGPEKEASEKEAPEKTKLAAAKPEKIASSDKTQRSAALARKSALLGKLLAARETRPTPGATPDTPADAPADSAKPAFAEVLKRKMRPAAGDGAAVPDAEADKAPDAVAAFQSRRGLPAKTAAPPEKAARPAAKALSVFPAIQRQATRGKTALKSLLGGVASRRATLHPESDDATPVRDPSSATSALTQKMLAKTEKPSANGTPKPGIAPPQRRDPLTTLRDHGAARSESEAERLTIFGARNHVESGATGGQRALMILGGIALLLVAVALWAVYLQSERPTVVEIAEDTAAVAPLPTDIAVPDPALQERSPLEDIEAALGLEDAAQQPPLSLGDSDIAESDISAQSRPETPEPPTGRIAGLRSAALIAPVDAVPLPAAPAAPAPFGTAPLPPTRSEIASTLAAEAELAAEPDLSQAVSDSVAEALAAQPPQSTLPAGEELLDIAVTSGRPASVPPARPEGLVSEAELAALRPDPVPAPEPAPPVADAAPPDAAPQGAAPAPLDESALQIVVTEGRPSSVPPARPETLAPEIVPAQPAVTPDPAPAAEADADDQASLATPPPGGVALTALRPAARPATLEAATEAAAPPAPDFANASALAVATSRQPGARPSQFAAVVQRTIQRTQSASTAQPARATPQEPVQTASAAVAAPAIPTSASVAREATQTRAINLRQINLIGVMGTSSNRRALVRLSNGRIVTVRIGESLDGGQVTAIGDSELRYMRRGRDVVLRLAS